MTEPKPPGKTRSTRILERVCAGDSEAASELLPVVYVEMRKLAEKYLNSQRSGHTLQPTALVHEAFVRLASAESLDLNGSAHFAALCAKVMREVLVDHSRRKNSQKRGGELHRITLSSPLSELASSGPEASGLETIELVALDDSLKRLAELDPDQAKLVDLRFFGGMTLREIAEVLDVSHTTVKRNLRMAQAWLLHDMTDG